MEEFLLLTLKMPGQNFCYIFYMHSVTVLRKKGFFNLPPAFTVSFSLFLQKIRYNSKLMQEKPDIPPGLRHDSVLGSAPLWKLLGCENVFNLLICFYQANFHSFSQLNVLKVRVCVFLFYVFSRQVYICIIYFF